jgi:FkbM family methyltransferase
MARMPGTPPSAIPERIVVADVGARDGFTLLPALRRRIALHAFEPDADAPVAHGVTDGFAEVHVATTALADQVGEARLHVTRHPALSSLRAPDLAMCRAVFGGGPDEPSPFDVVDRRSVGTLTLDGWAANAGVAHIDVLKIDTQGTEAEVLRGAQALLGGANIGVLRLEVSFWPLYAGQAVFSDIDVFLRARGYDLVDVRFTPDAAPPGTRWNAVADATWCGRPARWPPTTRARHVTANAVVLAQLGYGSTAASLLADHGEWPVAAIDAFLKAWGRPTQAERRRARARRWMPPPVLDLLRRARRVRGAA